MRQISRLIIILLIMIVETSAFALTGKDIEAEKKLGSEAVASAESTIKLIKDEKYTKRVETIGQQLAAIAKTNLVKATYGSSDLADFDYTFKVVDDKEVNAASLPAGYVYVNKGLLDKVESDDELAGVLAHEIAHIAHHHMLQLLKKQSKYDAVVFALLAAAILGKGQSSDVQNVYLGAKLWEIAKLNAYSQEAEDDADATAIAYMLKTRYNPVGMLTFMEKLARDQAYDPVDPGVFQSHPLSSKRANNIISQLKKHGIKIDRRAVTTSSTAIAREVQVNNTKVSEVAVGDRAIFRPANTQGSSSAERAKTIVDLLNRMLDSNPEFRDVKQDGPSVFVKQTLIVEVKQEDADLAGLSRDDLAAKVKQSIQSVLLSENLKLMY